MRSANTSTYYLQYKDWAACPRAALEPGFKRICNPPPGGCTAPPPPASLRIYDGMPAETASGERVRDALQRTLRAAWGRTPPQIDFYVRTGCNGVGELALLLPSIELFWPEHLGEVIIVLDVGDNATLEYFLPQSWRSTRQSYRFVYEDAPCLPGRIFNQISYLNLDMHSSAEYVVTIDSDCVLHSPVTPDILFDEAGRLLLPVSSSFQVDVWRHAVEFFTGAGTYTAQSMITQPVAIARATLSAYRAWFAERASEPCLYDMVARFSAETVDFPHGVPAPSGPPTPPGEQPRPYINREAFCWMCQINTFLGTGRTAPLYNLVNTDDMGEAGTPYLRYGLHTTWERFNGAEVDATSRIIVEQGLCRALGGMSAVPGCASVGRDFVDQMTFEYASSTWMVGRPGNIARLDRYLTQFQAAERETRGGVASIE